VPTAESRRRRPRVRQFSTVDLGVVLRPDRPVVPDRHVGTSGRAR
jgi:hypothetical protein